MKRLKRWLGLNEFGRLYTAVTASSLELFIIFLCLLTGAPTVFAPEALAPMSVLDSLSILTVRGWALMLTLGSLMDLLGILRLNLRFQRAGLMLIAGSLVVYLLVLLQLPPPEQGSRWFGILLYAGLAAACLVRYRFLGRLLSTLKRAKDDQSRAETPDDRLE